MQKKEFRLHLIHSATDREYDLRNKKRALHPTSGRLMRHSVSRHINHGNIRLVDEHGEEFKQGTLFPSHVTAGQITKIEEITLLEWHKWMKGKKSRIKMCVPTNNNDHRITMRLKKFGVDEVGALIHAGSIGSVFPEKIGRGERN